MVNMEFEVLIFPFQLELKMWLLKPKIQEKNIENRFKNRSMTIKVP